MQLQLIIIVLIIGHKTYIIVNVILIEQFWNNCNCPINCKQEPLYVSAAFIHFKLLQTIHQWWGTWISVLALVSTGKSTLQTNSDHIAGTCVSAEVIRWWCISNSWKMFPAEIRNVIFLCSNLLSWVNNNIDGSTFLIWSLMYHSWSSIVHCLWMASKF